ncbi:MAG TPA: class I SAM-dependent methyltransferase [Thermoplasmata archaeon]|nr:class I SAM-dependent methyltransferase [Thermoplasmata archaeon]
MSDRSVPRRAPVRRGLAPATPPPRERFLGLDRYRVEREWNRYEGTPQRDLFRSVRERFLDRWAASDGWVVDLGAGPGRFSDHLGGLPGRRVAVDLSLEALRFVPPRGVRGGGGGATRAAAIRADAARPPFAPGAFRTVALLGNPLGFAGADADRILSAAEELVAPGGTLLVEVAPGPGERARYLARLPVSSLARLLRAPVAAVAPRVEREGYAPLPERKVGPGTFRRHPPRALIDRWGARGWTVLDTLAVAPALGGEPDRVAAVAADPRALAHLVELEERLGRRPARWPRAAAVLFAVRRPARAGEPSSKAVDPSSG